MVVVGLMQRAALVSFSLEQSLWKLGRRTRVEVTRQPPQLTTYLFVSLRRYPLPYVGCLPKIDESYSEEIVQIRTQAAGGSIP